jgi:hypothetical protein
MNYQQRQRYLLNKSVRKYMYVQCIVLKATETIIGKIRSLEFLMYKITIRPSPIYFARLKISRPALI